MDFFGSPVVSTIFSYGLYFANTARLRTANLLLAILLILPVATTLGSFSLGENLSLMAWISFVVSILGFAVTYGRVLKRFR